MEFDSIKDRAMDWTKPPTEGYRNNRAAGFLIGMAFGPIGVGLFLRSFLDFVLSLVMCLIVVYTVDVYPGPICWLACGIWVVTRMKRDSSVREETPPTSRAGSRNPASQPRTESQASSA